jgi:hypothetical protein
MDKWIGLLMITICMAMIAIGSVVAYQMFGTAPQKADTFGNQFSNKTNSTTAVETAVAPVSISIEGYMVLMSVVFVIISAGVAVAKVVMGGGRSNGMR